MGTLLISKVREEYPDRIMCTFSICHPSTPLSLINDSIRAILNQTARPPASNCTAATVVSNIVTAVVAHNERQNSTLCSAAHPTCRWRVPCCEAQLVPTICRGAPLASAGRVTAALALELAAHDRRARRVDAESQQPVGMRPDIW
jgi:hypothetical protein